MNPLDARCNITRNDAICVSQLKNAKHIDPAILQERPDVKIFLPFRFFVYRPEMLFQPNTYNRYLGKLFISTENTVQWDECKRTNNNILSFSVAPGGDHVISLIDEISYMAPPAPLISQYDDINPEQFCNGDNRPANCGQNCMCTHKVDIPLNAVVEVVLVDEGMYITTAHLMTCENWLI